MNLRAGRIDEQFLEQVAGNRPSVLENRGPKAVDIGERTADAKRAYLRPFNAAVELGRP